MNRGKPQSRALANARIALLLFPLVTCSGVDNFRITETSQSTVSGATIVEILLGDLGFGNWLNLDITQNETLANQGIERHQLDTVYLHSLTLDIIDGHPDQDFSFIEEIRFYVESSGLDSKLIAHGGPFIDGLTSIGMDLENVNLASYAGAESMTITTDVTGRRPNRQTTLDAEIVLSVDVNVAGILCGSEI
jgi:hypothetical protein